MATFLISIFVLLMQFLWKHIDDMVGKGLEWTVIVQLLFYISASLVPMALPLAILLSSLMTFGNLGEHYELVAFKAAGVSLKRILRPLALVILFLSGMAFVFSNYWLPIANLKSRSLLYDVREQRPSVDIKVGIFSNASDDITIRVKDKKEIDGVEHLYDVLIYDHSEGVGNRIVTVAESGTMTITPDKRFLEFRLFNGTDYREDKDGHLKRDYPLVRSKFKENLIRTDLEQFKRTDEELFKSNYRMKNLTQLANDIDTFLIDRDNHVLALKQGLKDSYFHYAKLNETGFKQKRIDRPVDIDNYIDQLPIKKRKQILNTATNLSRNSKSRLSSMVQDLYGRNKHINLHKIEWHKKLTLPFACIILFLIGAPLGAIIRKGGLGMPIVISVLFFLLFHILSITGEKMTKEGAVPAAEGMWMASAILLPIGLFFTYKATSDSSLFKAEVYSKFFKSIFGRKKEKSVNL